MWNSIAGLVVSFSVPSCRPTSIYPALALLVLLLPAMLLPAPSWASEEVSQQAETSSDPSEPEDEAADAKFGEVIEVTARRRSEDIQKIPVSVTAFDTEALKERSVHDISDLSELTANMDFSTSGGFGDGTSDSVVVIRGVGQIDTALFSDSGVGIYVDGVYVSRAQGGVLDLLDVDRVEVLRGPQGTLYGKNTNGGAIQLISRRPGTERAGRVHLTLGRFDRLDGRASIDLPMGDSLRASVALMATNRDGWSRSLITDQYFYDDNRDLGRVALLWDPSDSFSAHLSVDYTRERESGGNQIVLQLDDTPLLLFYNQVLSDQGIAPFTLDLWGTDTYATSFTSLPAFQHRDTWGAHLNLEWTLETVAVRSITAYRTFDILSTSDADGAPNVFAERDLDQDHYQISQEFQLSGADPESDTQWLLGALYFSERPKEYNRQRLLAELFPALEAAPGPIYSPPGVPGFLCNPGPPPPDVPCFGGAGNLANFAFFIGAGNEEFHDLETDSWAIFGESTWALSDRLSLTLGGRWTEDDKQFAFRAVNGLGVETSDLFNSETWSDWSGRASLSFQATPDVMLFSTLSRGFKSGGFNGRPQQRQTLDRFDPETVLSWELGMKSDWLDHRLRLNATSFLSDYEDIHFGASVDVGGMPVFVTQNAGDAEIWGFELELQAYPAPAVQVVASVGHLNSEIVALDPRVPADSVRLGNVLPKSPSWSYSLGLQSSKQLADNGALISRVDYSFREKTYPDFANTEAVSQDAYGLLSARILYSPPSGDWDLALFGTNLTDEEYLESGFSTGAFGVSLGLAGRPREWGLEASLRF